MPYLNYASALDYGAIWSREKTTNARLIRP